MTLPIVAYNPKVKLRLHTVADGWIDPTDEDVYKVFADRTVNAAAGKWEVHLTSRRVKGRGFIDRIQPMDYVEISMSESGGTHYNPRPPMSTTMRGFVDNVQETVDASGNWRVVVNGRDYGKLLLQFQVYYLTELDPVSGLLGIGKLQESFGVPGGILSPSLFVSKINEQLIVPNFNKIRQKHPDIPALQPSVTVPSQYAVNGFAIQPFTGPVWNLLTQYASRPWVEVFIADQHAPILFYRFPPYFTYDGVFIDDGSGQNSRPHYAYASSEDVVSFSLGKSDNEVFNYYFTYPIYSYLNREDFKTAGVLSGRNPYVDQASFDYYGFRPLEMNTSLIPSLPAASTTPGSIPPETIEMAGALNDWLRMTNQDNHRFLNGSITLRGAGNVQPGAYLNISGLNLQCYVASVRHSFDIEEGKYGTIVGATRVRPI